MGKIGDYVEKKYFFEKKTIHSFRKQLHEIGMAQKKPVLAGHLVNFRQFG